mgnify:FL=1|jgi:hypothetical protein|tara:strand:+ start:2074 stop:2319 length:246 start_codon:yes stop_codon:yes gene_type:complete
MEAKNMISEDELKSLQELVGTRTEILKAIGELELRKMEVASKFTSIEESLSERRDALEEKYGHINVDLSTGEYVEVKEEKE